MDGSTDLELQTTNSDSDVDHERVLSIWANLRQILESDEAVVFFEAFHAVLVFFQAILGIIIGVHFRFLTVSPLETHLGIILCLIAATLVYTTAYLVIKVKPQNAAYRFIFGLICLVSGIFSAILSLTLIISPLGIFVVSLCPILIIGIGVLYHWYRQIYEDLFNTAGASDAISSREGEIDMQRAEIAGQVA
ncbi:hypothetical protein RGQ29_004057 [Quercus rubra]|uniref:Uncharacterized protein n=1 Tax=Quercus rubra TaxID=3512 RepID=A0AAN7IEY3_QUERU|nr:hypothetical protein RGQ29_004057 [Quercus rubra]